MALKIGGDREQGLADGWVAGLGAAAATALGFALLCFFANTTWGCNFVLPHAYAATLGIALAVGSFALLLRHRAQRRRADLVLGDVLAVLAVATKIEIGVAIAGVYVVATWAHRLLLRPLAAVLGTAILLSGLAALFFRAQEPGDHALLAENLTKFGGSALLDPFFLRVAGLDDPLRNLMVPVSGLAGLALLVASVVAAERLPREWHTREPLGVLLGVAGVAGIGLLIPVLADVQLLGASVLAAPVVAGAGARVLAAGTPRAGARVPGSRRALASAALATADAGGLRGLPEIARSTEGSKGRAE